MHEAIASAILDVDMKPEEEEQVEALHKKAKDRHKVVMGELRKVLDGDQAASQGPSVPTTPVPNGRPPKIMDTLKPKEPLREEMNLEEANQ